MTETYAKTIADLTSVYLKRRDREPVTELLGALGCCHLKAKFPFSNVVQSSQTSLEDEPLVRETLVLTLRSHVEKDGVRFDGYAILEGLSRRERWRDCLFTLDDAYNLTLLLLDFMAAVETGEDDTEKTRFLQAVLPGAFQILWEWTHSPEWKMWDKSALEIPGSLQICRAFFGSAWCDLVLCPPGTKFWNDRGMISSHRPPFLPGLLPEHLDAAVVPLPDMDLS